MIRVLIVDDSRVMRSSISRILSKDTSIEIVGTAQDGREAVEKAESLKPDVITMDVEMPIMNGIEALRKIMDKNPVPVIMMSSLTKEGAEITMEALQLGACDFVTKDFANFGTLASRESEIISKVKNVARNRVKFLLRKLDVSKKPVIMNPQNKVRHEILAIGASTGGPPALQHILTRLPRSFPVPVVIAQHMPKIFTQSFSQRLDAVSQLNVKEAEEGETIKPGTVYLAPGDKHMSLKRKGMSSVSVQFNDNATYIYRPSVDLLMGSTAAVYDRQSFGVILTGMGNDGLVGMKDMKAKGGYIIAQDEDTCVVYGMPRAVVAANLADAVLPIDKISEEIMRML